jgi:hypothetical protein
MTAKYNVFLPLADVSELKSRVVTVNGVENTVSPVAAFFRTNAIPFNTPVTITYHNVYTDGGESGESPPIEVIAGEDLPLTINSFFAKLYTGDPPVEGEAVVLEITPPTPPPVADEEPEVEVAPSTPE